MHDVIYTVLNFEQHATADTSVAKLLRKLVLSRVKPLCGLLSAEFSTFLCPESTTLVPLGFHTPQSSFPLFCGRCPSVSHLKGSHGYGKS